MADKIQFPEGASDEGKKRIKELEGKKDRTPEEEQELANLREPTNVNVPEE